MKKKLTEKIIYEPNQHVKVAVENKPVEREGMPTMYNRRVTITIKCGEDRKGLAFGTSEDIGKFIEDIDVEDPQISMELEPSTESKITDISKIKKGAAKQ